MSANLLLLKFALFLSLAMDVSHTLSALDMQDGGGMGLYFAIPQVVIYGRHNIDVRLLAHIALLMITCDSLSMLGSYRCTYTQQHILFIGPTYAPALHRRVGRMFRVYVSISASRNAFGP